MGLLYDLIVSFLCLTREDVLTKKKKKTREDADATHQMWWRNKEMNKRETTEPAEELWVTRDYLI